MPEFKARPLSVTKPAPEGLNPGAKASVRPLSVTKPAPEGLNPGAEAGVQSFWSYVPDATGWIPCQAHYRHSGGIFYRS
jgi:hypothetical protein